MNKTKIVKHVDGYGKYYYDDNDSIIMYEVYNLKNKLTYRTDYDHKQELISQIGYDRFGFKLYKTYNLNNKLHNINGPAEIFYLFLGIPFSKKYYLNGIEYSKKEYKKRVKLMC